MKNKTQQGFTLVETLVAITVLLLVIIGPMTIAQRGIQQAYFATDQSTAVFLAQEAIEAVREHRDNNALQVFHNGGSTDAWLIAVPNECKNEDGCAYDGDGSFGGSCTENDNCVLRIQDGKYTHSPGVDSQFTRTVFIEPKDSNENAMVTVTVSWNAQVFGGNPREVKLQTWLYNHYKRYE